MKIKHPNDRKQAGELREKLLAEYHELISDEDFDNTADAEEVWKKIEALDKDIEAFDQNFPGAVKKSLDKNTKESENGLQKALAEIAKLDIPEAQKAALRKSVALAAKKFSGNRRRIYDDVASLGDLEEELATARAHRDTMKAKLESMTATQQEQYWDSMDEIENKVRELEAEVGLLQRQALKKLQDAKAAVVTAVEDVKAVADVHTPESGEDAGSDTMQSAKAYYETAFKAFTKYVNPHVPNDSSVEHALQEICHSLSTEADVVREIAKTHRRDPRKQDSILAMASIMDLPSRAFTTAMSDNDSMQKVAADWRDVLTNLKNKIKTIKGQQPPTKPVEPEAKAPVNPLDVSSGDADADADAEQFVRVMKTLEPKYAALFKSLPVGASVKPLLSSVAAFEREIGNLHADGLTNKDDKDMYPGYGHILVAVSEVMTRYANLMRKALSK